MTTATGGTVTESAGHRIHTFTSSADLVVSVGGPVDFLLVGGAGGGGRSNNTGAASGGGGGGAVKTGTPTLTAATYPVVIGGGGAGAQTDGVNANGTTGTASTFNGVTAGGGGGGGRHGVAGNNAADGGGGGGGGSNTTLGVNPAGGTSTGGFNGGAGYGSTVGGDRAAGGAGGAGAVGVAAAINTGGNGGAGVSNSLSGAAVVYGGGGGGAAGVGDTRGSGGTGGGMSGLLQGELAYPNASANTGGGGGGGAGGGGATGGGNGGSGLAIVRYLLPVTITDAGDELYLNGDAVSLTGTNFLAAQGVGTVKLSPTDNVADGSAVTQTVTGWADTSVAITVVVGALAKGVTLYLFVTNNLGASNATGFPVVLVATPVTVTDAGDELFNDGEAFTITGTHFLAVQSTGRLVISPADDIDDAGAVTQTVNTWAATSIAATAVKGGLSVGVGLYLFVENAHGVSNAAGYPVEFLASPVTLSDAGDELYLSGDAVTVTGANFLATQGDGFVTISPTDDINDGGAVTQTVNTWANTSIAITVVQGALPVGVVQYLFVENNQGSSNASGRAVSFLATPVTVTDAGDEAYDSGDAVTVTGTNFVATQGAGRVYISPTDNVNDGGRVQQTVNSWANASIAITTVQGALAEAVPLFLFVRNWQGTSNSPGHAVQFTAPPIPPIPGEPSEFGFIEGIEFIEPIE